MQLRLPWPLVRRRPQEPERAVLVGDESFPIDIRRHHLARRYVLRVTPERRLSLTVPRRGSIAAGIRFAKSQDEWIAREWERVSVRAAPWGDGTDVWFRGERLTLRSRGSVLFVGELRVQDERRSDARVRIETWMRRIAESELPDRARALAIECDLTPSKVVVRNQRSRWGACSGRQTISLNWRLVQMPPAVCDYVIFHELAHLKHPNHSRTFWREVAAICPHWQDAERWLRKHGRDLV